MVMDFRDNVQKCQEYIQALEEEKLKIQVFQRELPLCLELVTQAIETCKQQLSGTGTATTECFNGHSECSEQTTSNGPILEEFIPLKRNNSSDDYEEEEHESHKNHSCNDNDNEDEDEDDDNSEKSGEKSDWLRSVQLWNQTPDPLANDQEHQPKMVSVVEVKRNGAFHPFQKEKTKPTSAPAASTCSSAEEDGGGGKKGGQAQRKARRCWSPELHRRFLHALQHLGGSHVATPKQIRDLMKVDGLTNDEVKSHLQKYRLHTRRPSPTIHANSTTTQAPQFVVMGGIWVPAATPEYAAVAGGSATGETATNGLYAPVAAVAVPPCTVAAQAMKKQQISCSQSHSEGATTGARRSSSPATSSSTHTTTASHAY